MRCTVEVIADSDTQQKWGVTLARQLASDTALRVRATTLPGPVLADLAETDARAVVLACASETVQALLHGLTRVWAGRPARPVVITGYPGLAPGAVVDDLLLRAGADIVLANSAADAERFREVLEAVDADPRSVVQTALPFPASAPHDPSAAGRDRAFTVAIMMQPEIPPTHAMRTYALTQVVEHAGRRPDRQLVVNLTGSENAYRLPTRRLPDNVSVVDGSTSHLLDRTDFCVTISSTAALEAMHRHIPTAILTDFGVAESLGNVVFLDSGALTSWPALHAGALPATDAAWAARNGVHDADPYRALVARVAELTDRDYVLAPLRPWYSPDDSGFYLEPFLTRHGLDLAGRPLAAGLAPTPSVPLARRALRSGAGRMYQVGVRRLEPRIKRWAQL